MGALFTRRDKQVAFDRLHMLLVDPGTQQMVGLSSVRGVHDGFGAAGIVSQWSRAYAYHLMLLTAGSVGSGIRFMDSAAGGWHAA